MNIATNNDASFRRQLRKKMRHQRKALSARESALRSALMCQHLGRHAIFRKSHRIATYFAHGGEINPGALLQHPLSRCKSFYLPLLRPRPNIGLFFGSYAATTHLQANRFAIPEPKIRKGYCQAWSLDLMLLPLLAYDQEGNRLGMGGGFYDRSLAYLQQRQHWHTPILLGLAFRFQAVPSLPKAIWDIPLDGIATEQGIFMRPATLLINVTTKPTLKT